MRAFSDLASSRWVAGATIVLLPFTTPPRRNHVAGIVFGPGLGEGRSLGVVTAADPKARIVDMRWRGRLVFVSYDALGFPDAVRRSGALYLFDAVSAGCHAPRTVPRRE